MKKIILCVLVLGFSVVALNAAPPQPNVGDDCITTDGRDGTVQRTTVTYTTSSSNNASNTNSSGNSTGAQISGTLGVPGASATVSGNTTNSRSNSQTTGNSTTTTTSYSVEKNVCAPNDVENAQQMSPASNQYNRR